MSGYMVTAIIGGVRGFFMVNSEDPDRACEEVAHCADGKVPAALTPLSNETLAHYDVRPKEPWLCFTAGANKDVSLGMGWGVFQTAFRDDDSVLEDVNRGELRIT